MKKPINLDVLIVYSGRFSASASSASLKNLSPFSEKFDNESYNPAYIYLLKICKKFKLKVGLATSTDVIGPGLCKSFWKLKKQEWQKVCSPCFSNFIFNKSAPTNDKIQECLRLLFSSKAIKSFNNLELFNLFCDKQQTYDKLAQDSIPTVSMVASQNATLKKVQETCNQLEQLAHRYPHIEDFSHDIVMKDRFGSSGENVYKFKAKQYQEILDTILKNKEISFIVQPFVKFEQGFSFRGSAQATDIRLIYIGKKIVQSNIRIAKTGDFRCNEHLGGTMIYLPLDQIPQPLVAKANSIAKILNDSGSLYAIDFVISNQDNIYLLEGNAMPGLDWHLASKDNEIAAKYLIRLIVKAMSSRIKKSSNCSPISNNKTCYNKLHEKSVQINFLSSSL